MKIRSKFSGATRRAAAQHLGRLGKISPLRIKRKIQAYVASQRASGKQVSHVTYPTAARWFDMSVYDLEKLALRNLILDTHVDSRGVRWLTIKQLTMFLTEFQQA